MKEMRLFYTPVWQASIAANEPQWPHLRQTMLDKIQTLVAERQGIEKTNFGGWQSADDLYKHREFGWVIGRIMALANELATNFSSTRTFDDGLLWANVNGRGHFNALHTHPDAVLSGVIYLKVEREEQGVIQFLDAREGSPTTHWRCFIRLEESTPLTQIGRAHV